MMKLTRKAFDDKMYWTGMAILALVACIGFLPLLLAEEQAGFQVPAGRRKTTVR